MLKNITVSFPGLGIESFDLDNVAFKIGENFEVMWYGVVIALGMLMAIGYAAFRCKQSGISIDDLTDIAIFTILFGVIGARLYYVAFSPNQFKTIWDVLNLRSGGLAIYGGIIAGAVTIFVCCLVKKISWRKLFDCVGPGVMIAQAMGRWGNFFNGEAYGGLVQEGHPLYFLRMGLISRNTYGDFGTYDMVYVHPTFLYESLWNILGFILINIFFKKKKFDGQNALYYFAWYGFGRMFIEGLRTDALYIGDTGIRVSQLLGFLLFAVATALIVYGLIYVKNHPDSKLAIVNNAPALEVKEEKKAEEKKAEEKSENTDNG
ncbi:MAG: prolipoprotein diacylglyceryl transferase [Clostridia bacterium]|nr:prolipoprotein diacylglyceryl transferase [Clostridia bacterium]